MEKTGNKRCVVVAAGNLFGRQIETKPGDLVIAADAGYRYCVEQGIKYDILVGDFDSAPRPDFHGETVALPVRKDVTDTWQAMEIAAERGYDEIILYGGGGGRIDHTLANIQTVCAHAIEGRRVTMLDDGMALTAVHSGTLRVAKPPFDNSAAASPEDQPHIGVFAFGGRAEGVSISGTLYTMEDGCLEDTFPLGVSNLFAAGCGEAVVSVKSGTLIVCWQDRI